MCSENRWLCFECNASKSWRYSCELFPDKLISTSLITYSQVVRRGYIWSMAASCNSFMFKWKIPSSAPISRCWSLVSGWIHEAVQWIRNGHSLKIFEKQAPICTFGVGGKPFETGRGGVCRLRCDRLGGTGGVLFNKSGCVSLSKERKTSFLTPAAHTHYFRPFKWHTIVLSIAQTSLSRFTHFMEQTH